MTATNDQLRRQLQLQDALLKIQAEQSLRAYVEQAWPILEPTRPFLPNWHIDLICEYLEAVTAGQINRLMIVLGEVFMITASELASLLKARDEMEALVNSPVMKAQMAAAQLQFDSVVLDAAKYLPDSATLAKFQSAADDAAAFGERYRTMFDDAIKMVEQAEAFQDRPSFPVIDTFTPSMMNVRSFRAPRVEEEPFPERTIVRREVKRKLGFKPFTK